VKPEDLIADLRDIHLPPLDHQSLTAQIVWWPLLVFSVLMAIWLVGIWRRQNWWRTEIRSTLDRIESIVDRGELVPAWQQLAHLLKRIAIKVNAEPALAGQGGEQWLSELDVIFDTNEFKAGPGRGLINEPYVRHTDNGAEDIRGLIALVRSRLSRLKPAR